MTREEVYAALNEVFREVFDDDSITLNDATTSADIEGWDSLEHVGLMVAIETRFGFEFDIDEVNAMKNVGEMVDVILRHCA